MVTPSPLSPLSSTSPLSTTPLSTPLSTTPSAVSLLPPHHHHIHPHYHHQQQLCHYYHYHNKYHHNRRLHHHHCLHVQANCFGSISELSRPTTSQYKPFSLRFHYNYFVLKFHCVCKSLNGLYIVLYVHHGLISRTKVRLYYCVSQTSISFSVLIRIFTMHSKTSITGPPLGLALIERWSEYQNICLYSLYISKWYLFRGGLLVRFYCYFIL